jgi:hypothetical protein
VTGRTEEPQHVQSLAISASPLQAVPQTSVIVDLVSANHVRQISSARLFKVAETKQNSVAIVRKGGAAIASDCSWNPVCPAVDFSFEGLEALKAGPGVTKQWLESGVELPAQFMSRTAIAVKLDHGDDLKMTVRLLA